MKTIKCILFSLFLFGSFVPTFSMKKSFKKKKNRKKKGKKHQSNKSQLKECKTCRKKAPKMSICSRCNVTTYCSRKCQTTDWGTHEYHCELIKERKQSYAHLKCATSDDQKSFKNAIRDNNPEVIKQLLAETDLDCNKEISGDVPLLFASEKNKPDVVEELLKNGADVNAIDEDDLSALNLAIDKNNTKVVEILLKYDADICYDPGDGYSALCRAIYDKFTTPIVRLLLENGADPNEILNNGTKTSALQLAAAEGLSEITSLLLEYGATIDQVNSKGETALHLAVKKGRLETTKVLINKGASKQTLSKDDFCPIFSASYYDHVPILTFLLSAPDEDIRQLDTDGFSLLYMASDMGNVNTAKFLIKNGADVNRQISDKEYFPLYIAADSGHLNMVKLLLANGANINQKTVDGETALSTAIENGHQEVADYLQNYKPSAEKKSSQKQTKHIPTKKDLIAIQKQQTKKHTKKKHPTPTHYNLNPDGVIHPQLLAAEKEKQLNRQKRKEQKQKKKRERRQRRLQQVSPLTLCQQKYDQRVLRWFNKDWRKTEKHKIQSESIYRTSKYYHCLPAEILHDLVRNGRKTIYINDDGDHLPQREVNGKITFAYPLRNPWHPGKKYEYGIFHSTKGKENGKFFHAGFQLWQPNSREGEDANYIEYPDGEIAPSWPKNKKKSLIKFRSKSPEEKKLIYTLYLPPTDHDS